MTYNQGRCRFLKRLFIGWLKLLFLRDVLCGSGMLRLGTLIKPTIHGFSSYQYLIWFEFWQSSEFRTQKWKDAACRLHLCNRNIMYQNIIGFCLFNLPFLLALSFCLLKGRPPLSRTRETLIQSIVIKMLIVQYFVRIRKKADLNLGRTGATLERSILFKTTDFLGSWLVRWKSRRLKVEVALSDWTHINRFHKNKSYKLQLITNCFWTLRTSVLPQIPSRKLWLPSAEQETVYLRIVYTFSTSTIDRHYSEESCYSYP